MTSLRTDGDKSAKVWAKRLNRFLTAMNLDGADLAFNVETGETGVVKDGIGFSEWGEKLPDDISEVL